jgi:hypothetical protein
MFSALKRSINKHKKKTIQNETCKAVMYQIVIAIFEICGLFSTPAAKLSEATIKKRRKVTRPSKKLTWLTWEASRGQSFQNGSIACQPK